MPRLPLVLAALLATVLATHLPATARASCASAVVVVDGHVLFGRGDVRTALLPARGAAREAVSPACNDTGGPPAEDGTTTVRPLRGLPPTVAVSAGEDVYVVSGSMVALSGHPLRRALSGGERSYRERHPCRREDRAMRGTLAEDGGAQALTVRRPDRTILVNVDAATRLAGRPAWQPLRRGQRVMLRTSLCGPPRVADTIRLAGPVPAVDRYERSSGDEPNVPGPPWAWAVAGAALALLVVVLLAVRAGRRLGEP